MKLSKAAIKYCSMCSPKVAPDGCCHKGPIEAAEEISRLRKEIEELKNKKEQKNRFPHRSEGLFSDGDE